VSRAGALSCFSLFRFIRLDCGKTSAFQEPKVFTLEHDAEKCERFSADITLYFFDPEH
jgi:hypothetical protein